MDAAGIDLSILSVVTPATQALPAADAVALARDANDEAATTVRATRTQPNVRFSTLACSGSGMPGILYAVLTTEIVFDHIRICECDTRKGGARHRHRSPAGLPVDQGTRTSRPRTPPAWSRSCALAASASG